MSGSPNTPQSGAVPSHHSVWRSGYWLVLALIGVSYGFCASQATAEPNTIALLVQLLTVAVTLRVAEIRQGIRRAGWVVLSVAGVMVAGVALAGSTGRLLSVLLSAASMVAYLVAPLAIIDQQLRHRRIDGQVLLAAIAAYILVGMFFTFVYNFVALVTLEPTFGADQVDSLSSQLFFSFTTLTTTGYGNIVPQAALVQSIAIAEAITGQLFLVIAVARVVAGWQPDAPRVTRSD